MSVNLMVPLILGVSGESGGVEQEGITYDTELKIIGAANNGSDVYIHDQGAVILVVKANAVGFWEVTSEMSLGVHLLTASSTEDGPTSSPGSSQF